MGRTWGEIPHTGDIGDALVTGKHSWPHFPEAIVTVIASLGLAQGRKGPGPSS